MGVAETPASRRPLNVSMLLTDSFGGYGGIAKFNADFVGALSLSRATDRIRILPRLRPEPTPEPLPEFVVIDRAAAGGKVAFAGRVLAHAATRSRPDLVICGHINLLPFAWPLARRHGAELALVIHGIEAWTPHRSPVVRALARRIDHLLAVSRYSRDRFLDWAKPIAADATIMPNCVDLDRFVPVPRDPALAARYGLGAAPVLLTMARLAAGERYKGIDEILEAMPSLLARCPDLRYLVVGDGDDRGRLEGKARSLDIAEAVVFTGRIPEDEKVAHYGLASAFVMPSTGEGFGIVFIEAAACGVPVIGSLADGSRDALLDGRLGRLIDPGRPAALIEAIEAALAEGRPAERLADIRHFGWDAFRARVDAWCVERQTALRRPA